MADRVEARRLLATGFSLFPQSINAHTHACVSIRSKKGEGVTLPWLELDRSIDRAARARGVLCWLRQNQRRAEPVRSLGAFLGCPRSMALRFACIFSCVLPSSFRTIVSN